MFQRTLRETTRQMYRYIVAIGMAAPLQCLLNTAEVVALEKVSFSETQNPKIFVNEFTVDGKHYLLNTGNLTQRSQIQLSKKQKTFSETFFAFLIYLLNLKHFPK